MMDNDRMLNIMRQAYRAALGTLPAGLSVRIHYFRHHKRLPNLRSPRRFTEKVIHRKLYERDFRMPILADKIAVKKFVAERIGPEFVTPILWSGTQLPRREDRNWAIPYVIKPNNGSGANIFVRTNTDIDWEFIEQKCAS